MITQPHNLLTYLRTKQVFQLRFKGDDVKISPVRLSPQEIYKHAAPGILRSLVSNGEIEISKGKNQSGDQSDFYSVTKSGEVNYSLIPKKNVPKDPVTQTMITHLQNVSLATGASSTDYFNVFLKYKKSRIDLFVTVDKFGNRFHSPVTSFHRTHRPNILLYGQRTESLDIAQSQPTVLAKILLKAIGENEFSQWITEGRDIYSMIEAKAGLDGRDAAKKKFFEIAFSPASSHLADIFGDAPWIRWINEFKQTDISQNPHGKYKRHSNLAWLLQNTESAMMRAVWSALTTAGIPFLSVHDEIIIQSSKIDQAEQLLHQVLSNHLSIFKICRKEKPTPETASAFITQDTSQKKQSLTEPYLKAKDADPIYRVLWDLNFPDIPLPKEPVRLDHCTMIINPEEFYKSHLSICTRNNGSRLFEPYYARLQKFFKIIN